VKFNWNWGYGIATVYTVFALATIGFAWFAISRPVDLVSEDYYARSLDHDRHQMAVTNGRLLGRSLAADVAPDGRQVVVTWPPEQLARLTGEARLYRPSNADDDRQWPIAPDAEGRQRFTLDDLPAGRWVLQLDWRAAPNDFYVEIPVMAR